MTPTTARSARPGPEPDRYLTRSQVARMLGVSPNTVTRWAREGRLPSLVTLGGHHRFERSTIERIAREASRSGSSPESDGVEE
jgi:excisionase family DNA binding protein